MTRDDQLDDLIAKYVLDMQYTFKDAADRAERELTEREAASSEQIKRVVKAAGYVS